MRFSNPCSRLAAYVVHNGACRGDCAPSSSRHAFYFYLRKVEGAGHPYRVENREPVSPAEETFAQAFALLKDEYGVNDSEVARTIGAHVSTVNNWVHGKANPRPAAIRALASAYPKFTEGRLFAAIGKRAPAPQTDREREETLKILDRLTEEQRRMLLIQARAVADSND